MSAAALKERLRADLKTAMRERKTGDVAVIRTLIAAVDNAEAVPTGTDGAATPRSGTRAFGDSSGEVARRELDDAELDKVFAREIETRLAAAEDYAQHGRNDDAARLREEAKVIEGYRD